MGCRKLSKFVKKLHGTYRADRDQPTGKILSGKPPKPDWLSKEAAGFWDRWSTVLLKAGLLTPLDGESLALLCQSWADYISARQNLKDGLTVRSNAGNLVKSPYLRIAQETQRQFLTVAKEFGLTPSSRQGIKLIEPESQEPDPFEELLKRRREMER